MCENKKIKKEMGRRKKKKNKAKAEEKGRIFSHKKFGKQSMGKGKVVMTTEIFSLKKSIIHIQNEKNLLKRLLIAEDDYCEASKDFRMKFLILLAQAHEEFRVTELQALAGIYDISLDLSNYTPEVC